MTAGRALRATSLAVRRRRFLVRLWLACRLASATIDVRVGPDVDIGRGVRVRVGPGDSGVLHVGAHSRIGDAVEIRLDGGELRIGEWVEIRRGVSLMVGGILEISGPNLVSWGTTIHCDDAVHLAAKATLSEYVTITDSVHGHDRGGYHLDSVTTAPVRVGVDTWIGAKATITPGVTVGDGCVVGAGAVVTRDVSDGHIAIGVPARARPR